MATLGRAFVEVHADTSPFAQSLRQQLNKLGKDAKVEVDTDLDSASAAATEAGIRRVTRDREVNVRINRRRLRSGLSAAGSLIGNFAVNVVRILGDFFNFGRQIGQIFGEAFGQLSSSLRTGQTAAVGLTTALANLAAAVVAVTAVMVIMSGIVGVLLALFATLAQSIQLILTLLPGFALVGIGALGPLILIFTNLTDAIKATTGTAEEFNNTISNLGENTQGALTGLRDMVQFFLRIRESVQESFFEPINQAIENLDANLGPTFQEGFERVAGAAGRFVAAFIELFEHPNTANFFENIFRLGELGFDEIGGAIVELAGALANLVDETFPNVEEAIIGIGNLISGWADSINEFADNPDLQDTLDTWEESFGAIAELAGTIVDLTATLIRQFGEDGVDVLEDFNGLLERIIEFFESDAGQAFFDGLRISAAIVLVLVETMFITWAQILITVAAISQLFSGDMTEALQTFLSGPLAALGPAIIGIIGLVGFLVERWRATLIPAQILVNILIRIVEWLRGIGRTIGDIIGRFRRWAGGASTVLGRIRNIRGVASGVRGVIGGIVGRIRNAVGVASNLLSRVRGVRNMAGNVRSMFSRIAGAARSIRGPLGGVRSLLSRAWSIARNFRGALSAAATFARNIASAIGSINFPSPPSWLGRIPGLQEGGIVTNPTRALIGEAGPEVVIPLTRPSRARELFEASGLGRIIGGDGASMSTPTGMAVGTNRIILELRSGGSRFDDALLEVLRRAVRIRGGNVQAVIG